MAINYKTRLNYVYAVCFKKSNDIKGMTYFLRAHTKIPLMYRNIKTVSQRDTTTFPYKCIISTDVTTISITCCNIDSGRRNSLDPQCLRPRKRSLFSLVPLEKFILINGKTAREIKLTRVYYTSRENIYRLRLKRS